MDLTAVEESLQANIAGFKGPIEAEKTPTGQSNPTFILTTPEKRYVLRSKPRGVLLKSAHAVDREFRVLGALHTQGLPVPKVYYLCEDEAVIGAIFYVMDFVEGDNFNDPRLPDLTVADRSAIYDAMNAGLAAVHSVDIQRAGLGDYGKPGGYFQRQFSRWQRQYIASETGVIADMDALMAQLAKTLPKDDGQVSLVHGDWRIDNLLFKNNALVAILDWELSTLGHPLADLGAQLMQWAMPVGAFGRGLAGVGRHKLGIPDDASYIETYANRMKLHNIPDMRFYTAFAFFRMAAILQGVKKRALEGNASDPEKALELGSFAAMFASQGLEKLNAES